MKTNFHHKNFVLSLAFIMSFNATQKWPIEICLALFRSTTVNMFNRKGKHPIVKHGTSSTPFIADTLGTANFSVFNSGGMQIAGILFQSNVCYLFLPGSSCCPYYRAVRNSKVSERRELTVLNAVARKRAELFSSAPALFPMASCIMQIGKEGGKGKE